MYQNLTQASPLKNSLKKAFSAFSLAVIALTVYSANVSTVNAASISSFGVQQTVFNPNNESADISFNLTNSGNITLEVFDGNNPIRTLAFRQPVSAGLHNEYTWDGKKTDGTKVSEGTYMVQLFYYSETFSIFADDNVTVSYDDDNNNGVAPVVSSDYASPNPFDPDTENTYVYFTLNTESDVTVEIYNGSSRVDTLISDNSLSAGAHSTIWDGRNSTGNKVTEGTYTYKVTAQNSYDTDTETGSITVEYDNNNGVAPVITSDYASPNPFDPDTENTYVYFTLNTESDVTVEIFNGSTRVDTLITDNTLSAGAHTKVWDGRNSSGNKVSEGTYTYKITAQNSYDTDTENGTVTVEYEDNNNNDVDPNISNAYATPTTFDPEDNESTTVHFTVNTCVYVTAKVYKQSNDSLVKTLSSNNYLCEGSHTITWNGRDTSGNEMSNGDYYIRITVTNNQGSDWEEENVTIDTDSSNNNSDAPTISDVDVNPYTFNPDDNEDTTLEYSIDECSDVTVKVYDEDGDLIDTLKNEVYQCEGDYSVIWDGEDNNGDMVDDGVYTFEVYAENEDGDDTATADTEVDTNGGSSNENGPEITNVSVDPDVFDPTEESTLLKFRIDECADATIKVVDSDNHTVKTLLSNREICSGYHSYTWNGKDSGNDYVDDDNYEFVITVDNNDGDDSARADVEVDSNGSTTSERCADYEDVSETNPYCDAIIYVTDEDIFSGYPDGSFKPYQGINRAETTKVLLKGFGYTIMSSDGTNLGFSDVDRNAWYMPYLRTAQHYGIIKGYPDGTFRPSNTVNRVELLKVFLETADVYVPACSYQPYNDTPISEWYSKYVCYAKTYDLMDADYNNNFNPAAPMTRGDVAELFLRFHEEGLDDNVGTHNDTGSTTVSGAPDITNVSLSLDEIKQGGSTQITYKLNVKSDVTVEILDDNDDVVRTLVDDVNQTSGSHSVTWDSEDDDGDRVAEGDYTVKIRATNSKGSDKYLKDVVVDNSASTTTGLKITDLDTSRTVWNPSTQGSLKVSFTTNKTATVTVAIYDEDNDLVKYLWDGVSKTADDYEILWNGKDRYSSLVSDGIYTIKVTAKNSTDTVKDEVEVEVNR